MRPRILISVLFASLLVGCGGVSSSLPGNSQSAGFVNHTKKHNMEYLWQKWAEAQQSIASEIWLNPIEVNVPKHMLPGDTRAYQIQPQQIVIEGRPDLSPDEYFSVYGVWRADPTGEIRCPQPCDVIAAWGYSLWGNRSGAPCIHYAQSWEELPGQEPNFDKIMKWEMENHILAALGYDMSHR